MRPLSNPIVSRELGSRMRNWPATLVLFGFLAVVTAVAIVAYEAKRSSSTDAFDAVTAVEGAQVGRTLFDWTLFLVLLLIHFVVPAVAGAAIAGERERRTLAPLQLTLVRPRSIVLGKLVSSLAYVMLLAVAAAPILAIGYLVGGVDLGDLLRAAVAVVFTALVLGAVSILCSAFSTRVQVATVAAYAMVVLMTLGSLAAYSAVAIIDDRQGDDPVDPPAALLVAAPLATVADFLAADSSGDSGPFDALASLTESEDASGRTVRGEFWPWSAGTLLVVSVVVLGVATRRVRAPGARDR